MPANALTSANFLFTSDYPVDKIITGGTGFFTVAANTVTTAVRPHNLPFAPLMNGSFSLTSDYGILYPCNAGPLSSNPTTSPFDQVMRITSDSTNIYFKGENYTGSSVTFYSRYYGFMPSSVQADVAGTQSLFDNYQFATDYNYTKLYLAGFFDQAAVGFTPTTSTVAHNLGQVTQAQVWKEVSGLVTPLTYCDAGDTQIEEVAVSMDTANLNLRFLNSNAMRLHVRIYLDT